MYVILSTWWERSYLLAFVRPLSDFLQKVAVSLRSALIWFCILHNPFPSARVQRIEVIYAKFEKPTEHINALCGQKAVVDILSYKRSRLWFIFMLLINDQLTHFKECINTIMETLGSCDRASWAKYEERKTKKMQQLDIYY